MKEYYVIINNEEKSWVFEADRFDDALMIKQIRGG